MSRLTRLSIVAVGIMSMATVIVGTQSRFLTIWCAAIVGFGLHYLFLEFVLWRLEMQAHTEQPAPQPPAGTWEEILDDHTPPPQVMIEDDGDPWRWVPYGTAGEVHHGCLAGWSCSHCRGVIAKVHAQ